MSKNVSDLTPKQQAGIAALLSTPSVEEAAKKVNVSPGTLYRWLKTDAFKASYRQAKAEIVGHAMTRLQQAATKAVDVLITIMEDSSVSAQTRCTAAKTILERSVEAFETESMLARIEALEKSSIERRWR